MANLAFGRVAKGLNARTLRLEYKIVCGEAVCDKCDRIRRPLDSDVLQYGVKPYCDVFGSALTPHGRNFKRLKKCVDGEVK